MPTRCPHGRLTGPGAAWCMECHPVAAAELTAEEWWWLDAEAAFDLAAGVPRCCICREPLEHPHVCPSEVPP